MKISITKIDLFWSYIGTFMSLSANILMIPFIIYYLDADMLGLWYVFTSIGAVATLFDFGFAVTFARNITYCWSGATSLKKEDVSFIENKEPDYYLMKVVIHTCRYIYFIISLTALILLLTIGTWYVFFVSKNIIGYKHIIAWLIYSVAVFLNLYYGYYASFLRGVGAVATANKNTIIARTAQIILTILLLVCGCGIVGVCTAYLAYGTVFRVLGKYKFFKYKDIGNNLNKIIKSPDKHDLKELFIVIWHNAWRDGVVAVANYCSNQLSIIICSLYFSLVQTGVYSLGMQIASAIATVSATLYTAYQPTLQEAYINANENKLKKCMSIIIVGFIIVFTIGLAATIVIGLPILRLIKPETVIPLSTLLGLCFYQFLLQFRNFYTSYFSCTNRLLYSKSFVISAIFCIVLSFVFVGNLQLGILGLISAQILSQAIYNVWAWPIKAHRELKISFKELIIMGLLEIKKIVKNFLLLNK